MVWQTHSLAPGGQDHGFQTGRGLGEKECDQTAVSIRYELDQH
jgi:hypothetical protein